eukprot:2295400-Pyramimonas_sp.AAC.2
MTDLEHDRGAEDERVRVYADAPRLRAPVGGERADHGAGGPGQHALLGVDEVGEVGDERARRPHEKQHLAALGIRGEGDEGGGGVGEGELVEHHDELVEKQLEVGDVGEEGVADTLVPA